MDDLAFGRIVRLARLRRQFTQAALATRARTSRSVVSRVEHGHFAEIPLNTIRSIAGALEIRVEVQPRTRAVDLDRVVNARHAALADYLAGWISALPGWIVKPEVSYSEYGERGVIDLLCWHAPSRSLLVVEIKTELLDFGELLGKLDAKERLARKVAERFGWQPASVSTCLLVAESTTNRRRAIEHQSLLRSALPDNGPALVRWMKRPVGAVNAMRFVSDVRPGNVRTGFASPSRVRTRKARPRAA